jgi:tripeptide aminopeptidase
MFVSIRSRNAVHAPASVTSADLAELVTRAHPIILSRQVRLAETAAPTGQESTRAATLASWFSEDRLPVRHDAVGNVIVRLGPSVGAPLAILAHLDSAFGPEVRPEIRRQGNRLIGPGIADNARGLAVLSMLPSLLAQSGIEQVRPIDLVATVGEEGEGDLRGARGYLDQCVTPPQAVLALDGGGDDRVVHVGVGSRRLRLAISGPGGHSWSGYGGPSALEEAMRLARLASGLGGTPPAVHAGRAVGVTIARLTGGEAINAIPARAVLDIELRALSESSLEAAEKQWRSAVCATPGTGDSFERIITTLGRRPAGALAQTHPVVWAAIVATRAIGRTPVLASGSSDANAALERGIPAIAVGAGGRAGDAHTPTEWYEPEDGERGVTRLLLLLREIIGW